MTTARDDAIERFATASQIDTDNADTLESVATAYLAAGRLNEAARACEQIIRDQPLGTEAQPYWFEAHLRLAEIRLRQGDPAAARALYAKVLEIWKDADEGLLALQQAKAGLARTH